MATEKQVAANRRNALKSTGPRSLAGKIKSRANALRHGLATKTLLDPSKRRKIDALTQIFARQTDAVAARAIAEAQVELHYVERYRAQLLAEIPPPDEAGLRERGEEITKILCNVPRLLRYERNAASNRNRAILKK